jgi:hypothetical protein
MTRKTIFFIISALFIFSFAQAGGKDSTKVSLNRYSLSIGAGWSHYINTLEVGADLAKTNAGGLSLKFYWEPEHRLSLGLETGYFRLYKLKGENSGHITMSAIPLLLNVRMRVVDHFYLGTGAGLTIMMNKITGIDKDLSNNILSLSNYQFSGSYIYPLNNHWNVGGELKAFYFGKSSDWIYTIQALCAVKL